MRNPEWTLTSLSREKHLALFSNEHGSQNPFVLGFAWLSEVHGDTSSRLPSPSLPPFPGQCLAVLGGRGGFGGIAMSKVWGWWGHIM